METMISPSSDSDFVYRFFYIDDLDNREYLGFCMGADFESYLDDLIEIGYSMADLAWDADQYDGLDSLLGGRFDMRD
jgi:hypothetical protein